MNKLKLMLKHPKLYGICDEEIFPLQCTYNCLKISGQVEIHSPLLMEIVKRIQEIRCTVEFRNGKPIWILIANSEE